MAIIQGKIQEKIKGNLEMEGYSLQVCKTDQLSLLTLTTLQVGSSGPALVLVNNTSNPVTDVKRDLARAGAAFCMNIKSC